MFSAELQYCHRCVKLLPTKKERSPGIQKGLPKCLKLFPRRFAGAFPIALWEARPSDGQPGHIQACMCIFIYMYMYLYIQFFFVF